MGILVCFHFQAHLEMHRSQVEASRDGQYPHLTHSLVTVNPGAKSPYKINYNLITLAHSLQAFIPAFLVFEVRWTQKESEWEFVCVCVWFYLQYSSYSSFRNKTFPKYIEYIVNTVMILIKPLGFLKL